MCSESHTADLHVLDAKQLRLIADPLRQRILKLLCGREMSPSELARAIEDPPSNLYYHVDKLRDAGLIRLVRTEPRRGAVEKYYRAVARGFTASPELLSIVARDRSFDDELLGVVRSCMDESFTNLAKSLSSGWIGNDEGSVAPVINGITVRTSAERMEGLRQRLIDLVEDLVDANDPEGEVEYSFFEAFFPVSGPAPGAPRNPGGAARARRGTDRRERLGKRTTAGTKHGRS